MILYVFFLRSPSDRPTDRNIQKTRVFVVLLQQKWVSKPPDFSGGSFWPVPYEIRGTCHFLQKVIFFYILMIFQIIKWICFVKLIEFSWIYINLKRFETLNFMYFSQISLILAKNDMFLWFHMGQVKNWPHKKQPGAGGLGLFYILFCGFYYIFRGSKSCWKMNFAGFVSWKCLEVYTFFRKF